MKEIEAWVARDKDGKLFLYLRKPEKKVGLWVMPDLGIDFVEHEESYTSKCDALALESIGKHEQYLGRRTKRGLFRSSIGKLINADQNGALNIMRKVVGDSYVSRIVNSGHSLCPVRYNNPFVRIV